MKIKFFQIIIIIVIILIFSIMRKKKGPLVKTIITSPFGKRTRNGKEEFHNGVDLRAAIGTSVYSPEAGFVSSIWYDTKGGNQMTIIHDSGVKTGYAHLSEILVQKGERIKLRQLVAYTGNTGGVSPHLHFTCRVNNIITDPSLIYSLT